MASERQIQANRRNAELSSGPRSVEGKSRVATNALKHGLTAKMVVLPNEDPEDFEAFASRLWTDFAPVGAREEAWVETIVCCRWRLRRVPIIEAAFHARAEKEQAIETARMEVAECRRDATSLLVESLDRSSSEKYRQAKAELESAISQRNQLPWFNATRALERYDHELANLCRHEQHLFRLMLHSLHELQRLQAERAGKEIPAPRVVDLNVDINHGDGLPHEGEPVPDQTASRRNYAER